eukprot:5523258-Pyramimonas_sp.AAC.1
MEELFTLRKDAATVCVQSHRHPPDHILNHLFAWRVAGRVNPPPHLAQGVGFLYAQTTREPVCQR